MPQNSDARLTQHAEYLLRVLVALACADGEFHPREEMLVRRIARSHQVSNEVLEKLIEEKKSVENFSKLSYQERFDILYNLLLMMKADNVVMDEELSLIQKMATNLGFQHSAIMELYAHVRVNFRDSEALKTLSNTMRKHTLDTFNNSEGKAESP